MLRQITEVPLIDWSSEDLKNFMEYMCKEIGTVYYESERYLVKPNKVNIDRELVVPSIVYLQEIDKETRPSYTFNMEKNNWDPAKFFIWYITWKNIINNSYTIEPVEKRYIYFLEIFFNTDFRELPLLIHHSFDLIKLTVRWRLSVGK